MLAERTKKSGQSESAVVVPGSLVGCAAYLSSTKTRAVVTAAEPCKLVAFGPHELERLLVSAALTLTVSPNLKAYWLRYIAKPDNAASKAVEVCLLHITLRPCPSSLALLRLMASVVLACHITLCVSPVSYVSLLQELDSGVLSVAHNCIPFLCMCGAYGPLSKILVLSRHRSAADLCLQLICVR